MQSHIPVKILFKPVSLKNGARNYERKRFVRLFDGPFVLDMST